MDITDPQYKTDDGSALRIFVEPARNNFLSEQEGRAIFDEVTYVEVISPGSRDSTPIFEVKRVFATEMNRSEPKFGLKYAEYRKYIEDFEANEARDATLAGTPLSQWPEMARTMAASLKSHGIFTVEGLAGLADSKLSIVGPDGRTWRAKAEAFIANAKGNAAATALAAEVERMKVEAADKDTQIAQLAARVRELEASKADAKPKAAKDLPPVI